MIKLLTRINSILSKLKSRKVLIPIIAFFLIIVMLLWLAGVFSPKINFKNIKITEGQAYSGRTAKAFFISVPITETASGTVQAVHETTIASKLTARVTGVYVKAGEYVKKDQILVRLDETELVSKLQQAKAQLDLSEAAQKQAQSDYDRYSKLYKTNATSRQDFENAQTRLRTTEAEINKANGMVSEIESLVRYANIVSPIDGVIVDKEVDAGDTVLPGQVLLKLYDNKAMQLIANVRESLANKLTPGQDIGVKIDALDKICLGKVSEVVPEANSANRTFQVKVVGPCPRGIYSGMFGRIIIPLGKENILVIPKSAVIKAGQLELAAVVENGVLSKRYIRTGRHFGDNIEVLSGMKEGESVALQIKQSQPNK